MIRALKLYLRTVGVVGAIKALWGHLSNSTLLVSIQRPDVAHPLQLRVPSTDVPTYKHVFVRKEYRFEGEVAPMTIVDAGANTGLASIYFANRYPGARIIAIEPEQANFELLVKNVELYPNVIPVQAALWKNNDQIELVDPGLGDWGYMTRNRDDDRELSQEVRHSVQAMTIDRVMEQFELESIDLLKLNIEGAEREVFEYSEAWIDRVNAMVVKLHDRMKPGCESSFSQGSVGFDRQWVQAGSVCLSRANFLSEGATALRQSS